jgi:hypothetical protein
MSYKDVMSYTEDGATLTLKAKESKAKLMPSGAYTRDDVPMATCKDTGNGYIFKFPAWNSMQQDHYVCLDYSQADCVLKLLNHFDIERVVRKNHV